MSTTTLDERTTEIVTFVKSVVFNLTAIRDGEDDALDNLSEGIDEGVRLIKLFDATYDYQAEVYPNVFGDDEEEG